MADKRFNYCDNWGLYCFEQKEISNGTAVRLECVLNGKDQKTKQRLEKGQPIYVYADITGKCNIAKDNYGKSTINVDGRMSVSNYTDKDGNVHPSLTIFADRVEKVVRQCTSQLDNLR